MSIEHQEEAIKVCQEWADEHAKRTRAGNNFLSYTEDFTDVSFDPEGSNQYNLLSLASKAYNEGYSRAISDRND